MKRTITLTGLALTAALTLTACGGTDGGGDGGPETTSAPAATAGATDVETATASPTGTGAPSPTAAETGTAEAISAEHNDADVMFARMMIPHHQQAVQMSEMLLAKEDIPAEIRNFAQKVIDAQGPEIDRMNAMLEAWGEEPMGMDDMEDMGHGGVMSGMMKQEDMQQLEDATGTEAARLYLKQMTAHHEGAIEMAQDEVDNGQNPQALQLAQDVITAQQAEIAEMEQLLKSL